MFRRGKETRHRKEPPDQSLSLQQVLPWNEEAMRQDLGLDILFNAMSQGDKFLFEVANVAVLSSLGDLDTIAYRQKILADSLKNAQVVMTVYQIAIDAIEGERKSYWSFFARYPSGVLRRSVEVLQMFVGMLKKLRSISYQHVSGLKSEGFTGLFAMLAKS